MDQRFASGASRHSPLLLATIGLMEVVITCVVVVGLFAAASGPFSWSSALQVVACAILGGLLWLADRSIHIEVVPVPKRTTDRRATVCR